MRVASLMLFVATLLLSNIVQPQSADEVAKPAQSANPCDAESHRQFDFWVGDWVVKDHEGKEVGRNAITAEQRGCALLERWTGADGTSGISINYYDPVTRSWMQHWVSPGVVLTMTGGFADGAMVLEGPIHYLKNARARRLRGTWTVLPDGRVRQHFVESNDDGKTWAEWFDGYYSRT